MTKIIELLLNVVTKNRLKLLISLTQNGDEVEIFFFMIRIHDSKCFRRIDRV